MKNFTQLLISLCFLLTITASAQSSDCTTYNQSYDVVNDFNHNIGSAWSLNDEVGGWASFMDEGEGLLTWGPYDTSGPSGLRQVTFELLVENNMSANLAFTIQVSDATAGVDMVSQQVLQNEFYGGVTPQSFTVSYYHTEGNAMEYKVWYHNNVIGAVTGVSVTNDADGNGACDCYGDTDGDGIVDKDDKCASVNGPKANGGCPWPDTDGDGVLDKDDNCKNEVGPASNNGCPEPVITEVAEKKMGEFAKTILFNSGRSTFLPSVSDKLDGIVTIMKEFSKATFMIEGHTDSTGSKSLNEKLSAKRAAAVKDYLVQNGVDASRLDSKGFGEDNPIDTNKSRAGRANNRRVEIKVTNE